MSKKHRPVIQYAPAIAERDGGWFCHYCGTPVYTVETCPIYTKTIEKRGVLPGTSHLVTVQHYDGSFVEVDHVKPKSQGGSDDLDNLVLACSRCNNRKNDSEYHDFKNRFSVEP